MAYPTDRTLYWRTDSTAGSQDGTTDTAGNSGTAAFESLYALIQYVLTTDADLTGQGPLTLRCTQAGQEVAASAVTLAGITTTASDYVLIECTGDAATNGISYENDSLGYQLKRAGIGFTGNTPYYRLKNFEICSTGANHNGIQQTSEPGSGSSDIRWEGMLVTKADPGVVTSAYAIDVSSDVTLEMTNCLVIANGHRACDARGSTATVDHCGFVSGGSHCFMVDSGITATNTFALDGSSEDWYQEVGSGSNNASTDGSAPNTGEVTITTPTDEFTNYTTVPSTADLTLKSGSNLVEAGTGSEAIDITGASRTGTADIGPFNFGSAASSALPLLNAYYG